ncbi:DUF975 family protein [Candidatus Weimeria sp. HCP3S3_B5]|uniref:DUF975 family protein n=1 Tax=Candidatus Weimeria sp. HCP3S3_B5 TaxID=3438871 RepID=UPI003F88ECC6
MDNNFNNGSNWNNNGQSDNGSWNTQGNGTDQNGWSNNSQSDNGSWNAQSNGTGQNGWSNNSQSDNNSWNAQGNGTGQNGWSNNKQWNDQQNNGWNGGNNNSSWNNGNNNKGWNGGYQTPPPVQRQPVFFNGILNRSLLKEEARAIFKGNYWNAVLAVLLPSLIAGGIAAIVPPVGSIISWIFSPILIVGGLVLLLRIVRGMRNAGVGDIFSIFDKFGNVFLAYFTTNLFIGLWTLLFVIPGIYKSFCWAMTFYIIADDPDISGTEARRLSEAMMEGHKMEFFILQLSFIGWALLSACTFGILGIFYVAPWMATTNADYYDNLRMLYEARVGYRS